MKKKFLTVSAYAAQISVELKKDATLKENPGITKVIGDIDQILSSASAQSFVDSDEKSTNDTYFSECRKELNAAAFQAASHLKSCGVRLKDIKIEAEGSASEAFIKRLSTPKILKLADHLHEVVGTNAVALAEQKYTTDHAANLQRCITNVREYKSEKQTVKKSVSTFTRQSQILLKKLNEQLKQLDIHMATIQKTNVESFTTYQKIRTQISHTSNGKRSLTALVTNKATKMPLVSVKVKLIPDVDADTLAKIQAGATLKSLKIKALHTKRTTSKGRFNILKISEGTYLSILTMHGFHPAFVRVYINPNNTFKLNVELIPIE
jgi:hypothetical protein